MAAIPDDEAVDISPAELGRRIRAARERQRWTQRKLADALNVSARSVTNWERGLTVPMNRVGAIEAVLGIDLRNHRDPREPVPEVPEDIIVRIRVREPVSLAVRHMAASVARAAGEAVIAELRADADGDDGG